MNLFDPTFQLPEAMSTSAPQIDELYYFTYWVSVVFFVGIVGAMIYFAWTYRRRPGVKAEPTGHNLPLELAWTIAPVFILVILFHWGFKGYMDLSVAPVNAEEVRVRAFQWGWDFEYASGASDSVLHIPVGRPIKFVMSSNDVLHAFYIPEFRTKRDVVPGMYSSVWVQATEPGNVVLTCAEYCGGKSKDQNGNELAEAQFKGHWAMQAKVVVESEEAYQKYQDGLGGNKPPEERGRALYEKKQCITCHTTDGSKGIAPTWKGLYGKIETLNDGKKIKVDENYIRESIYEPSAKIVMGYPSPSIMPTFKGVLKDTDIDNIIAYMKTLKAQ